MANSRKNGKIGAWIIVGIMVVAMGGFGLGNVISGSAPTATVIVGKTEVDLTEYGQTYQNAIAEVSRQLGQQLSPSDARLQGIPNQVTTRLIQQATLSETARISGLYASDQDAAAAIAAIPAFQNSDGSVNSSAFQQFLTTRRISEDAFVDDIRGDIKRETVLNTIAAMQTSTPAIASILAKDIGEKRVVGYVEINFDDAKTPITQITDADILAHYNEFLDDYMGPVKRDVDVAYVLPNSLDITDEALRTIYDSEIERFTTPALVTYSTLSFADIDTAATIKTADDLAVTASERGLSPEDYQFTNARLATLPATVGADISENGAGFYGPIEGALGYSIFVVEKTTPAQVTRFEEAKPELAEIASFDAMTAKLNADFDRIQDLIAGGVSPEDLARDTVLEFKSITLSEDNIAGLTDDPAFVDGLGVIGSDDEHDLITLDNRGVAYAVVTKNHEPTALPLEEARETVISDLTTLRENEILESFAQSILASSNNSDFTTATAAAGLEVVTTEGVTQQQSIGAMPLPLAFEAFDQDLGTTWEITDQQTRILANLVEIQAFDPNDPSNLDFIETVNSQLQAQFSSSLVQSYLNAAATEYEAQVNPTLINRVVGADGQ